MTGDLAAMAAFTKARLDEAEATVYREGSPPNGVIAWLTYRKQDGSMGYTTVAHGDAAGGPWIFDGKPLPEPASVLVVYDPVRALRDVAVGRLLVARCERILGEQERNHAALAELAEAVEREERTGVWDSHGFPDTRRRAIAREADYLGAMIPVLREIIAAKAAVWSDHPDYGKGWKP